MDRPTAVTPTSHVTGALEQSQQWFPFEMTNRVDRLLTSSQACHIVHRALLMVKFVV